MANHKATAANASGRRDYKVGKGKPPVDTQWKPGECGNKKGRPPGVRNVPTEVRRMLRTPTKVRNGDRFRSTTTQEAAYIVLREKALAGDARALDRLLDEAARYNNEPSAAKKGPLPEEDRAILDAYTAEVLAASGVSVGSKKKLAALDEHTALAALLRCELSFFVRRVFNTIVPGRAYCPNGHLDAIGHQLTRIHRGESKRLVINLPPRHLKTIYASITFPAWVLGHDPTRQIVIASYSLERAAEIHRQIRAVVESPWYQDLFSHMRAAKQTETQLITTTGGGILFTSVDARITGYGGDLIIIDDATKADGPAFEVARKRANAWFSGSVVTRPNDHKAFAIIIVQQRLHARDLSGHVLAKGGCEHLNLPVIATEDIDIPIGPGKVFTRRKGDLLHPERMGWEEIESLKRDMESGRFAAQYQQDPPVADSIVLGSWFKRYEQSPARRGGDRVVQSWDTAYTVGGDRDFSVCVTSIVRDSDIYVLNVFRDRLLYPDLRSKIADLAAEYGADTSLIEDFGAGAELLADLRRDPPSGMPRVIGQRPVGTKSDRLKAVAAKIAAGRVHLPAHGDWVEPFLDEVVGFPDEPHDDQVDALSQLLKYAGRPSPRLPHLNVILIPNDNLPPWTVTPHRLGKPW